MQDLVYSYANESSSGNPMDARSDQSHEGSNQVAENERYNDEDMVEYDKRTIDNDMPGDYTSDTNQTERANTPTNESTKTLVRGAADPTLQRVQDLMGQVVRQGVNISLRSLQVWADLARQLGLTALGSSATATYDLIEKLLAAQREIVDELVAAQRQFAQGCLDTTATGGEGLASR
jgi:hypothetical protein